MISADREQKTPDVRGRGFGTSLIRKLPMKSAHKHRLVVLVGMVFVAVGCNQPSQRLNAPPQGVCENTSTLQDSFVYMVDNEMLEDESLADIHFVPHSAELNGLGARRLERYARLLKVYGGSVRYATSMIDDRLVEQRMASIRDYLSTTGIAAERIKLSKDLPGGLGMTAREAIVAKTVGAGAGEVAGKGGKKGSSNLSAMYPGGGQ
jgi:hypothetical protein